LKELGHRTHFLKWNKTSRGALALDKTPWWWKKGKEGPSLYTMKRVVYT